MESGPIILLFMNGSGKKSKREKKMATWECMELNKSEMRLTSVW